MPKKVQPENPSTVKKIVLPTAGNLTALMKQTLNYDSRIATPTADRAELMEDYKTNKHVDPPAFNIVKAMFKLSDDKLAKRLRHLLHYIEFAKDPDGKTLSERAGGATGDIFDERGKTDEDGETDLRPRHLRQPGASGADIEKAITEAGGAPVVPLKH
jgi:hypothetical protein